MHTYLIIVYIHESNGEFWLQVLKAQQGWSGAAGHKLEERRGGEGRGGEEGGRDVALCYAISFLHALHLEEEPLLLLVKVTTENVPKPQDHTVSGVVSSVVHCVASVGEGGGERGGGGEGKEKGGGGEGEGGKGRNIKSHHHTVVCVVVDKEVGNYNKVKATPSHSHVPYA